jgi:hypothetical protein
MPQRYAKDTLRTLRNEIPINTLIAEILGLPCKTAEGYFRFLCPHCGGFHTATNPKTNLARCFDCRRNFNTIDIAMAVKRQNFREAVQFLQEIQTIDAQKLCNELAASMSAQSQRIQEK